jgi:serine-type D-Ala-D-Ala carboxypeptidase/endopeptidase (penicillin-binding protein 4)
MLIDDIFSCGNNCFQPSVEIEGSNFSAIRKRALIADYSEIFFPKMEKGFRRKKKNFPLYYVKFSHFSAFFSWEIVDAAEVAILKKFLLAIVLATGLFFLSSFPAAGETSLWELQKHIDSIVRQSGVTSSASLGIYIKVLKSGQLVYAKNADLPLIPSSNLKVLTTAAAFAFLGSDYRYRTYIYGGPVDPWRGVMESSLYLVGSGDPTFTEPFMATPTEVLEKFAERLYARGLRRIKGDLIGDDSIFDRDFVGKGWKARYILDHYAAECGGLSLNGNLLQISITPSGTTLFPPSPAFQIVNKAEPGGWGELKITRESDTNRIVITGSCGGTNRGGLITVHNPPLFTTSSFGCILRNHGISISGNVRLIDPHSYKYTYDNFIPLCCYESHPLYDIARRLNKESDNFLAQQLFRTLGAVKKGKGTLGNSEAAVKEFMQKAGVSTEGLQMADGCGLSGLNRVTPQQLAGVLDYMYFQKEGKKFMSTLPQAGVDGTLKYRLSGTKVFAKTGTINENSSLSGYVTTSRGQTVVFSIITNNHKYGQGLYKGLEDQIVNAIAKWDKEI